MAEGEGGGLGGIIKWVIIALVVLLLIGGGVAAFLFFFNSSGEEEGAVAEAPGVSRSSSGAENILETPFYLELGSFVVNLSDGRRYLKTTLQLLLSEELAFNFMQTRIAEVKDLVVSELQSLSSEQLRDPKERTLLKQRLLRKLESLLPTRDREWDDPKPLKKVLVTEFYLQ